MNRRHFIKQSAAGFTGMVLGGLAINPKHAFGRPSKLRITDIRCCTIAANYDYPLIKVYTNQGITGLGEVRDMGYLGQALMLKPYLIGKDPLDIEGIMESIRPFSDHGRYGGGFSAVDMALFDIAGKAMGWPAWKLIGEKIHESIPIYGDTDANVDIDIYVRRAKERIKHYKPGYFEPTHEFDQPLGWQEAKEKKIIGGWYNHGAPWSHYDEQGELRYHVSGR